MKKLFNDSWKFAKFSTGTTFFEAKRKAECFHDVGLPHDWLIFDSRNLYESGMGWYRKVFFLEEIENRDVILRFEGIYMDCAVYVNNAFAGEWKYGYTTFEVDIGRFVHTGENEVFVSVNYRFPNSRWYTGAGIYRDVWLKILPKERIVSDGIYFSAKFENDTWNVCIDTEIKTEQISGLEVVYELAKICQNSRCTGFDDDEIRETFDKVSLSGEGGFEHHVHQFRTVVKEALRWDVDSPNVYRLYAHLMRNGVLVHSDYSNVGFRTLEFTSDRGFFLNGIHRTLHGVCEHHDLGLFGSAFHKKALKRRFALLKEMGVNAIRSAHNMPAKEFMDLADEMGFLVVSEAFDVWELPKNEFDYSLYFHDWHERDICNWVRRDRNHPSLLLWSVGNEISDTHVSERGAEICKKLCKEVRKYDSRANAGTTIASNYMPWENAGLAADVVDAVGYNYGEKYYRDHHQKYPKRIIYGSETASIVSSRGIYHFPYHKEVLADEDFQCSSLGNSATSWGAKNMESCILADTENAFSSGQFIWTGFDYIGEPTPYHTKNSYFGQLDTAGLKKDGFYQYQAAWTDDKSNPMIHIFPYWDFNDNQKIDVRICSNAVAAKLFLNNEWIGEMRRNPDEGMLSGNVCLPYQKGILKALALDESENVIAFAERRSFGDASFLEAEISDTELSAGENDISYITVTAKDEAGNPVENANNLISIKVFGSGYLVGSDNGDSTDDTSYQSADRRLFSGKCVFVIKSGEEPGEIRFEISSPGVQGDAGKIKTVQGREIEGIAPNAYLSFTGAAGDAGENPNTRYSRTVKLYSSHGQHLHPKNNQTRVRAEIFPKGAKDDLIWSITDDAGIPVKFAELSEEIDETAADCVCLKAISDGNFRLRCMSKSGTSKVRGISELEFCVSGFGTANTNPYEFVSAGLYSFGIGEIGNGNERGVATSRDSRTVVGFSDIDFGKNGSDEIDLDLFALTDEPYAFHIYEGNPDEHGERIGTFIYQKSKMWNVYQRASWKLEKLLQGITEISFEVFAKIHIKGFVFRKKEICERIFTVNDCDRIYGDRFNKTQHAIRDIGNNVTLEFQDIDFSTSKRGKIRVFGHTDLEVNPILVHVSDDTSTMEYMVNFRNRDTFSDTNTDVFRGVKHIRFVFLPGSQFDFIQFQFVLERI